MKNSIGWICRTALVGALATAFAPLAISAQTPPPAKEILERYTEALGGAEALDAVQYRHVEGTQSMPAMGMTMQMEIWSAPPNRTLAVMTIPGMGEVRQGFDGDVAWMINPMQGARVVEGAEREAMINTGGLDAQTRLDEIYSTMETIGRSEMLGRECWEVKMISDEAEADACFDVDTGLLLGMEMTIESEMGPVGSVIEFHDYSAFGGVLMPTRMITRVMGQESVMTIEEVSTEPFDESVFELPAEVKGLVDAGGGN